MTRWEEYAAQKGIQKRKRERMIWDEEMKEWRPRYGFKVRLCAACMWSVRLSCFVSVGRFLFLALLCRVCVVVPGIDMVVVSVARSVPTMRCVIG